MQDSEHTYSFFDEFGLALRTVIVSIDIVDKHSICAQHSLTVPYELIKAIKWMRDGPDLTLQQLFLP
jgi:hypothetical protein